MEERGGPRKVGEKEPRGVLVKKEKNNAKRGENESFQGKKDQVSRWEWGGKVTVEKKIKQREGLIHQ